MRIFADSAAEIDEQLFGIRQMRVVRIVAGIDKYFSEKDRYTKIGKPRYVSKDGLRQMRFDKPHMKDGVKIGKHLNLEFFNGTDTVPYQHVLYNLFKFWIL